MLHYAIISLIVAIIAGVFGFGGIMDAATDIARILFFLFIIFAAIGFISHLLRGGPPKV